MYKYILDIQCCVCLLRKARSRQTLCTNTMKTEGYKTVYNQLGAVRAHCLLDFGGSSETNTNEDMER